MSEQEVFEDIQTLTKELTEKELRKAYLRLRDKAYAYLARREHSLFELRRKLLRFDEHEQSDDVLHELIEENLQSDERFAEQLGRARVSAGKGPVMLMQELHKNKIQIEIIETVMATYQYEWPRLAEQVRQKKFGGKRPNDYKEWAKQARFLQQRGFKGEQIKSFTP